MEINTKPTDRDRDTRDEMIKVYREQQQKYVYYIISLSVSSIAFAIYISNGKKFEWYHIFLFLAILYWGLSIHFAIVFIKKSLNIIYLNLEYFNILLNTKPVDNKLSKEENMKIVREVVEEKVDDNGKEFNRQYWYFYFGVLLFLVYHILSMFKYKF